ncbi:dicarboxylate--CoA ligase PimA [uncultured Bradyrhizobium sp.]|nr:dicarboxylate--CoA ligase PimA [uncultured Bradyrhizobium sp.]
MTYPGEQYYPSGVKWSDEITRGTLPDLLSNAAAEFGVRPVLEFRDRQISYSELESLVETAAAAFLRAGYGKGTSVALFLGNSPDHPINFFGALKAGARIVHLSPLDGEIALSHKLSDSGARVLVTSNLSALLPTALKFLDKGLLDRLIVCEDDNWGKVGTQQTALPDNPKIITHRQFIEGVTKPSQWPAVDVEDVALLQYTGGTTGLPKGAMLSHGNLTAAVSIYDVWGRPGRLERNAIERVICVLPLFHIYALTVVLLSVIRRGHLISLHQRFDVEAVMRDIEVKRATVFPGVPTMWIAIASLPDLDKRDLSSLVVAGSGGAPLPVEVAKIFERRVGMKLKSGWGMTETCGASTGVPANRIKPGSIGLAASFNEVRLDPATGEILVRGTNVFAGYLNLPEQSAEAIDAQGWLHTGDAGVVDAEGYYCITGRMKDIIITAGGKNITPSELENDLKFSPYITDAVLVGDKRPYLTAMIMIDQENIEKFAQDRDVPFSNYASLTRAPEIQSLIQSEIDRVNKKFARVEQIKKFALMQTQLTAEDEELTPTMKLKRSLVEKKYAAQIEAMYR